MAAVRGRSQGGDEPHCAGREERPVCSTKVIVSSVTPTNKPSRKEAPKEVGEPFVKHFTAVGARVGDKIGLCAGATFRQAVLFRKPTADGLHICLQYVLFIGPVIPTQNKAPKNHDWPPELVCMAEA